METFRVKGYHWYTEDNLYYDFKIYDATIQIDNGKLAAKIDSYEDQYPAPINGVTGKCSLESNDNQGIQMEGNWDDRRNTG